MGAVRYDFAGEHVLVTGASRGIGHAVADGFARAGARVTILAEDDAVTDAAARLGRDTGATVIPVRCDITDPDAVRSAIAGLPGIDVLVNNAGIEHITPVTDESDAVDAVFRRIIETNVIGTWHMTRAAVPRMPPGARMIVTCSIWSRTAVAEFSGYCSAKHADLGFMRSMARELMPLGIRVNGVCPGWVRTDAAMRSLKHMAQRSGRSEDELLDEIVSAQTMDGLMIPEDVAPVYLFLASEASASMVGQALTVDRGEVMA